MRAPELPVARLDGPAREGKLLADYRHMLVVQRTELINRLRRHRRRDDRALPGTDHTDQRPGTRVAEPDPGTGPQFAGHPRLWSLAGRGDSRGNQRFRSKDASARSTGTAPIPVWSASTTGKVRLNRGGNRAVNCALHMIAVTQARGIGPDKTYVDKSITGGKTRTEAVRLLAPTTLGRRLPRVTHQRTSHNPPRQHQHPGEPAAGGLR